MLCQSCPAAIRFSCMHIVLAGDDLLLPECREKRLPIEEADMFAYVMRHRLVSDRIVAKAFDATEHQYPRICRIMREWADADLLTVIGRYQIGGGHEATVYETNGNNA